MDSGLRERTDGTGSNKPEFLCNPVHGCLIRAFLILLKQVYVDLKEGMAPGEF